MGALVACALAHDHPERVDGLVLLAPALELQLSGRLGELLGALPPLRRIVVPKASGSDVCDPEMRARNPGLSGVPLGALAELRALQRQVDAQLPGIAAPALVVMGRRDHTVANAGVRRLARRIGSGPAELVVLEESAHLVGIDVERDRCAAAVATFVSALPVSGRRDGDGRKAAPPRERGSKSKRASAPKRHGARGARRR
jgi:carboxylesterase